MSDAGQAFGSALRAYREQQNIPLSAIAEETKISAALLAALERGDLSRWPNGIFRRAFFREYVAAIGLSPDRLSADFARVFPDDSVLAAAEQHAAARLKLVHEEHPNVAALRRVAVVFGELLLVVAVGALAGWLFGVSLWSAIGAMALAYYPISNLCVERRRLRTAQPLRSRMRAAFGGERHAVSTPPAALGEARTHEAESGTSNLQPNLTTN